MPGLELWGHTWRWASDDLALVSLVSSLVYLTWVLLLLVYSTDLDRTVQTSGCATISYGTFLTLLGGTMGLQFLNSIAMFAVTVRGSIWEIKKRRWITMLLPMDWALWVIILATTIWGTFLLATEDPSCLRDRANFGMDLDPGRVVTVIVIYCWVVLGMQFIIWAVTYRVFPALDDSDDLARRKQHLDALMCGCLSSIVDGGEDDPLDAGAMEGQENSLEEALVDFIGKVNMTLSDLIASILLVAHHQSDQRRQRVEEMKCAAAAAEARDSSGEQPATPAALRRSLRVSGAFLTPPGAANSLRQLQSGESHTYELVEAETMVEAAHYAKFAVAAYGAKLYIYAAPGCLCGGALQLCGLSAMRKMRSLQHRDIQERRGEGRAVDVLEKEAILKYSRISEEDLVYVSQFNQGILPYFIALDHESQSVVLCVRGTMSLSDCITDAQFHPVPIAEWLESACESEGPATSPSGGPEAGRAGSGPQGAGPYAHAGILKAARAILADLEEHHLLESLMYEELSPLGNGMSGEMPGERPNSAPLRSASASMLSMHASSRSSAAPSEDDAGEECSSSGARRDAPISRLGGGRFKGTVYVRNSPSTTPEAPRPPEIRRVGSTPGRLTSFTSRAGSLTGSGTPRKKPRRVPLAKIARFAERMERREWRLVVTGHSLGAGVASLIALKLKPRFPSLHCWAYAAPGGLMSRRLAETMTSYCTGVAIGKDWVPRATLANAHRLRDELMLVSTHCRVPKFAIFWGNMLGCFSGGRKAGMFYAAEEVPEESKQVWDKYRQSAQGVRISALEPGMDFISPGRVIFFRPEKAKASSERTGLEPVWLSPGELQAEGLLVSKRCMADHMPHFVLSTVKRTARRMAQEAQLLEVPDADFFTPSTAEAGPMSTPEPAHSLQQAKFPNEPAKPSPLLTSWLGSQSLCLGSGGTTNSSSPVRDAVPVAPVPTSSNEVVVDIRDIAASPFAAAAGGRAATASPAESEEHSAIRVADQA